MGNGSKNRITLRKGTKNRITVGNGKYNRVTTRAASKRTNICSLPTPPRTWRGKPATLLPRHHRPMQGGDKVIRRNIRSGSLAVEPTAGERSSTARFGRPRLRTRVRASAAVGMAGALVLGLGAGSAFGYFTSSGAGHGSASTATLLPALGAHGVPTTRLVPGGTADVAVEVTNPNLFAVSVVSATAGRRRDRRRRSPDLHSGLGRLHQPRQPQRPDPRRYDAGAVVPCGGLDEHLSPERLPGRELLDPADPHGAFVMSGRRPHRPGRRVRLLLAVIGAVVGVLLTGATGAFGYWLATSADNPSLASRRYPPHWRHTQRGDHSEPEQHDGRRHVRGCLNVPRQRRDPGGAVHAQALPGRGCPRASHRDLLWHHHHHMHRVERARWHVAVHRHTHLRPELGGD